MPSQMGLEKGMNIDKIKYITPRLYVYNVWYNATTKKHK